MADTYEGMMVGTGTRIQAGVPMRRVNSNRKANGLLLRGVVVKTYVADSGGHPMEAYADDDLRRPTAVYCDVLVYPSIPGQRWFALHHVLVTQPTGGMHRGRMWKPRASTQDISGEPLEDQTSNPAHQDGDHVLVGFLNDSFDQPVVLRGLPHPLVDKGHEDAALGWRMKLTEADKDPDFVKHHGTFYGVDSDGNFLVDSTFANDGDLKDDPELGHEAGPPTDGKGSQTFKLPQDATFAVVLYDMTDPTAPNEVMSIAIDKNQILAKVEQNASLKVEEDLADAKLTLGDGAVKVAVADHLQTLYTALKAWLEAHTHSSGTGPTGVPLNNPATSWDSNINSSQMLIPDTQ